MVRIRAGGRHRNVPTLDAMVSFGSSVVVLHGSCTTVTLVVLGTIGAGCCTRIQG